ncbi:MAG TPA: alkaline phosphatase family protein [Solirubrobacteraceae bacterium]|jgi:hypothetical protein
MPFSSPPARRALGLCLAACVFAACAVGLASAAPSATVAPSDDVYATAKKADRNFGASKYLIVKRKPATRSYMRFNLDSAPPAGFHATLRVYPLTSSKKGLRLRRAADAGWTQSNLTFRSLPSTDKTAVHSGALRAHHWKDINVTRLFGDSGVLPLALATSGRARIVLASREAGKHAPRLIVRTPAGTTNVTPSTEPSPSASPDPVPPPAPAPQPAGPEPNSAQPCGVRSAAPTWQHVVWIVMENHSMYQIMGSASAPYINHLAQQCGYASKFFAETHPSLPNYIAMTSGDPQGISDDAPPSAHPLNVPSIFSQLGTDWKSLQEGMPSNCLRGDAGKYAVKHNPAAYYMNIDAACKAQDIPLGAQPDVSAKFTFITPDLCSDMHDCPVNAGDQWLSNWVPKILDSPEYKSGTTAVFLTFDEDDHSAGNQIATVVLSPSTRVGTNDATRYDHYSMLHTTEEMLGLPTTLGAAATANSMRAGFNL